MHVFVSVSVRLILTYLAAVSTEATGAHTLVGSDLILTRASVKTRLG